MASKGLEPVRSSTKKQVGKKHRKWGRNRKKCERYRLFVGKPNGPGEPGNKAGKNKV